MSKQCDEHMYIYRVGEPTPYRIVCIYDGMYFNVTETGPDGSLSHWTIVCPPLHQHELAKPMVGPTPDCNQGTCHNGTLPKVNVSTP